MERSIGWKGIDSNIANACMAKESTMIVDSNHIKPKVVKVVDIQISTSKILSFICKPRFTKLYYYKVIDHEKSM
jgi:hypothetical protein